MYVYKAYMPKVSKGFEVRKVGVGAIESVKPGTASLGKNLVGNARLYVRDLFSDGRHPQ